MTVCIKYANGPPSGSSESCVACSIQRTLYEIIVACSPPDEPCSIFGVATQFGSSELDRLHVTLFTLVIVPRPSLVQTLHAVHVFVAYAILTGMQVYTLFI